MTTSDLIHMMFRSEPIEVFAKILEENNSDLEWDKLLDMSYCERSYESVGGDEGYKKNPSINHERIEYLESLINFLESNGIAIKK